MKTKILVRGEKTYREINISPLSKGELTKTIIAKWQEIVNHITDICNVSVCTIMVATETKLIEFMKSTSPIHPTRLYQDNRLKQGNFCETVIGIPQTLYIPNVEEDPVFQEYKDTAINVMSYLGYPLQYSDGTIFGTLSVFHTEPVELSPSQITAIEISRDSIEKTLSIIKLKEQINNLAVIDPLTGLYNKHKIDEIMFEYQQELNRHISILSIAYISIVNFEEIKAKFTDNEVDEMIVLVAKIMKKRCRYIDRIGRISKHEFIILSKGSEAVGQEVLLKDLQRYLTNNLELEYYNLQIAFGNSEVRLKESIEDGLHLAKEHLHQYEIEHFQHSIT